MQDWEGISNKILNEIETHLASSFLIDSGKLCESIKQIFFFLLALAYFLIKNSSFSHLEIYSSFISSIFCNILRPVNSKLFSLYFGFEGLLTFTIDNGKLHAISPAQIFVKKIIPIASYVSSLTAPKSEFGGNTSRRSHVIGIFWITWILIGNCGKNQAIF